MKAHLARLAILLALVSAACADGNLEAGSDLVVPQFGAPSLELGSLNGADGLSFGLIGDVEILPDGSLLVLDQRPPRIVQISATGEILAQFGSEGEGPGEFVFPVALAVMPDDQYTVLDAARGLLTRVRVLNARHEFVGVASTPAQSMHMCGAGAEVVLDPYVSDYALERITVDGTVTQAYFALPEVIDPAFESDVQRHLRTMLGLGTIACLENGSIVFLPQFDGTVRAFHEDGEPEWSLDLESHESLGWGRGPDGSFEETMNEEGWVHRGDGVIPTPYGSLLVQLVKSGESFGGRESDPTEYRIVWPIADEQLRVEQPLPHLAVIGEQVAWGWSNEPFPRVVKMPVSWAAHRP